MATNKIITVTVIPTLSGDTIASYNAYSSIDGLLGAMTPAEGLAGKIFALSDGAIHDITVKVVWTTAGETTTVGSNVVVVDLSVSFILDTYTTAAAAYSLRQLKTGITNVIKVRRSSDNAELDFTADEITNGTLIAWTGVNDGFVTTWYDQSGNVRHLTQATTTTQPRIVNIGVVELENGKPTTTYDGTLKGLNSAAISPVIAQPSTMFTVFKNTSITGGVIISGENTVNRWQLYRGSTGQVLFAGGSGCVTSTETTNQELIYGLFNGVSSEIATNGEVVNVGDAGTDDCDLIQLGRYAEEAPYLNGSIQEIIIWESDKSADRAGIESEINTHYSVY